MLKRLDLVRFPVGLIAKVTALTVPWVEASHVVPTARANLACNTPDGCCSANFALGHQETMKRRPRTILGPFAVGVSGNQTGDPHFKRKGNRHQILSPKDPFEMWVCFFGWELEGTGAYMQEIQHLPSTASPTSELSLHYRVHCDPTISAYLELSTNS